MFQSLDASEMERAALEAHLRRLLGCTQFDAEAMWVDMNGAEEVPTDTPSQAKMRKNFTLRRTVQEYRSRSQGYRSRSQSPSPPLPLPYIVAGEQEQTQMLPVCAECGSARLEHAALQTRSADEGPSLFFKCLNPACDHFNTIVRPIYPR